MKYKSFTIKNYRAITKPITIDLESKALIPLVGINECGKTTILQSIFCFDIINDKEYKGIHLENTLNLYKTKDEDPIISSTIEISYSKLEAYITILNKELESTGNNSILEVNKLFPKKKNKYSLTIHRNLNSEKYFIDENSDIDPEIQNNLSKIIIQDLPYILYNDDFQDRPPDTITIPDTKPQEISGWLSIYERLFNTTNSEYSLFSIIKEEDSRRKDSIISDVEEVLNKTLSKAWKTFLLDDKQKSISVKINIIKNPTGESTYSLEVKIIEKMGSKDRYFKVVDRSKGFLWFFNFVMKLEFNPKISNNKSYTIYLLDEPGSYLHSAAQEKLCNKLKDISEKHGNVIYCTHSHHLLNPKYIPVNKIYIVDKTKQKNIEITPLTKVKTKSERTKALDPVYEALQIPAFDFYKDDVPLIAVEGMYDKYIIELFLSIKEKLNILAGTSADSIIKNIQFLNAYGINYIAIWDNDTEGRSHYNKAKKLFGEKEGERFDLLPSKNGKDRRMEDMISKKDLNFIKEELQIPKDSSYESIILCLYYKPEAKRKKIINSISDKTKDNFKILEKIINKRLEKADILEKERV